MKNDYEIIIQQLISKVDMIRTSDYIKYLYYKKIKLIEEEMKIASKSNIEYNIEEHITSLDKELNNLITLSTEDIKGFIDGKLIKANNQYKENDRKTSKIKIKAISYLLTLSVMLTSSLYIIDREKSKTKEVLFNTHSHTYYDELNLNDNSSDYLPKTDSDVFLIKKYSPWHIEGNQGKRMIYTYKINNMNISKILDDQDFENITNNLDYVIETEYKYKNELRDYDRYEEPIYKVIYQTQDYNDYIVKYRNIEGKILALLLCNLLIYMLTVKINNGPLIESLLIDIHKLQQSDKQLEIDYEIITSYKKYQRKN